MYPFCTPPVHLLYPSFMYPYFMYTFDSKVYMYPYFMYTFGSKVYMYPYFMYPYHLCTPAQNPYVPLFYVHFFAIFMYP